MITERGRVVAADTDGVWLETVRRSTCSGCSARNGCGHGLFNSYGSGGRHYVRALPGAFAPESFQVNDEVEISVPERALLSGALWVYLMPLAALLAGMVLASHWYASDTAAAAGAGAGLLAGLGLLRLHAAWTRHSLAYQPVVTAYFGSAEQTADARSVPLSTSL